MFHVKFDEENKIWDGCDVPPVFNPNVSLGHILLKSLALNGSKIAQVIHKLINIYFILICSQITNREISDK